MICLYSFNLEKKLDLAYNRLIIYRNTKLFEKEIAEILNVLSMGNALPQLISLFLIYNNSSKTET